MKSRKSLLILAMLFSLSACQDGEDNTLDSGDPALLVEGFLYAGRVIDDFKLTEVSMSGYPGSVPLSDASIEVQQGETTFSLVPSNAYSGLYHQADSSMVVGDSGTVALTIRHKGNNYRAESQIPAPIHNLMISDSVFLINASNNTVPIGFISWNGAANAAGYCCFIRPEDTVGAPFPFYDDNAQTNPFKIVHSNTSITFKSQDFAHYGTYTLYITAVNDEYKNAYNTNGILSFANGPSNIENGWGVFTAFNGKAIQISLE